MSRVTRWEHGTEVPLAATGVAFLVAFAWPILDPGLPPDWHSACTWLDRVTWAVFAVDVAVRLCLADHRGQYAARHVVDLLMVALPVLRPLRLLRLLLLLRVLNKRAASSFRGRIALYVSTAAALVVFCASLAVLDAERGHPDANITDVDDALWWSVTTVTTVGYGDRYPVTGTGRLVGVGLMLTGIALLGVVTGSIASWLLDQVRAEETRTRAATQDDLHELRDELRQLRTQLELPPTSSSKTSRAASVSKPVDTPAPAPGIAPVDRG